MRTRSYFNGCAEVALFRRCGVRLCDQFLKARILAHWIPKRIEAKIRLSDSGRDNRRVDVALGQRARHSLALVRTIKQAVRRVVFDIRSWKYARVMLIWK